MSNGGASMGNTENKEVVLSSESYADHLVSQSLVAVSNPTFPKSIPDNLVFKKRITSSSSNYPFTLEIAIEQVEVAMATEAKKLGASHVFQVSCEINPPSSNYPRVIYSGNAYSRPELQ